MVPSMRSCGGVLLVMWRSDAPLSIITLRSWCSVNCMERSVFHRRAQDLLGRGDALEDLVDAGQAQAGDAAPDHLGLDLGGRGALQDKLLELVDERHHLVERDPAAIPGVAAVLAPAPSADRRPLDL